MHFSLELPTTRVDRADEFVNGAAITDITRAAAAAGFDAVNVSDHPAPDGRWLDHGGHHALSPMVALAFAAAADPEVLLQTNVYIPQYRNPFLAAKDVLSLDVLSGGRLILGVAAGYLKAEYAALGVDFATRGARLDDALEVIDTVLAGEEVQRDGPDYSARGVRMAPTMSRGRPPIWVGGNSRAAMRRAVRYEGWAPFNTLGFAAASRTAVLESVTDLAAAIDEITRMAEAQQPGANLDICWSDRTIVDPTRSVDERVARIDALRTAGVTWMVASPSGEDRAELIETITAFGRDFVAPFRTETMP